MVLHYMGGMNRKNWFEKNDNKQKQLTFHFASKIFAVLARASQSLHMLQ